VVQNIVPPDSHIDIVALMVLEHQAEMDNRITRANFLTRLALYEEAGLNKAFGRPATVPKALPAVSTVPAMPCTKPNLPRYWKPAAPSANRGAKSGHTP
jgi:hypothetical protein